MLNDWFYSHSTWAVAGLVCSVLILLPMSGLFLFHRLIDWTHREHDTAMVGLSYALCGSIYTVMLAFVAVGTYETMDKTATIASEEANSLGALAFDSAGLPAELGGRVRDDVNQYIDIVTAKEWPKQRAHQMQLSGFDSGWAKVRQIGLDLSDFEPATPGQATVKAEMVHVVNELFSARRTRILAANAHLPDPIWEMLIFGLVLVAFYLYLFGPHSFGIHMAVIGMTMLSIGLVFTLIIALDYPFRGDVSVNTEAYQAVREMATQAFEPAGVAAEEHATHAHEAKK